MIEFIRLIFGVKIDVAIPTKIPITSITTTTNIPSSEQTVTVTTSIITNPTTTYFPTTTKMLVNVIGTKTVNNETTLTINSTTQQNHTTKIIDFFKPRTIVIDNYYCQCDLKVF